MCAYQTSSGTSEDNALFSNLRFEMFCEQMKEEDHTGSLRFELSVFNGERHNLIRFSTLYITDNWADKSLVTDAICSVFPPPFCS